MDYMTINFEASCLPCHGRSFPIEVGIASAAGTRSWLIRPHATWRDWDWTDEALAMHAITPETLERDGLCPARVFAELTEAVAGKRVIADSTIDSIWWNTLADAAGSDHPSPIEHVSVLLGQFNAPSELVFEAQRKADMRSPGRHRAGDDARWLWLVLSTIEETLHPAKRDDALWQWSVHDQMHKTPSTVAPMPALQTSRYAGDSLPVYSPQEKGNR